MNVSLTNMATPKDNLIIQSMEVKNGKLYIELDMDTIPEECRVVSKNYLQGLLSSQLQELKEYIAEKRDNVEILLGKNGNKHFKKGVDYALDLVARWIEEKKL